MNSSIIERLTNGSVWLRGLLMVLFFVILQLVARVIVALVAVLQFIIVLATGSANEPLLRFGKNLGQYIRDILDFLTFNNEERPFPFGPWPDVEPSEEWLAEEGDFEELDAPDDEDPERKH